MEKVIVIAGAPGSGKSTLAKALKRKFAAPEVALGTLRGFHLHPELENKDPDEEAMAFENFLFIIRNYLKNGYSHVIVHELRDSRVRQMAEEFPGAKIFTLVADDAEIEKRISVRNDGWRNIPRAIEWNKSVKERPAFANEIKIDNTNKTSEETFEEVLKFLA